jgi:DDE superfamily endonuclease
VREAARGDGPVDKTGTAPRADFTTHVSQAMTELIAARDWLTVYRLPPYAHELSPVESVWSVLKRSLANLVRRDLAQLTAHDGTHRAPPYCSVHRRSSGPSHHRRLCCPAAQPVLRPPPTPTRPAVHFPGSPVIGRHAPATVPQVTGPGRASPVPAATIDTFRAPYAGESLTAALPGTSPLPWPSPRFREARHSLAHPEGTVSNDAAGFASCYGPHRRSPLQGF